MQGVKIIAAAQTRVTLLVFWRFQQVDECGDARAWQRPYFAHKASSPLSQAHTSRSSSKDAPVPITSAIKT